MAGIDKTYVTTWEDYCAIVEWCNNNSFICPNGTKVSFFCYGWEEEDFDDNSEIPVFNTSQTQDYFLIKYCPIKVVQDRMREVYPAQYVESILNGTSKFDTFVRPPKINKLRLIKKPKYKNPIKHKNLFGRSYYDCFYVGIKLPEQWGKYPSYYNEDTQQWILPYELGGYGGNSFIRVKSWKALIRRMRTWHLPKGTVINVRFFYYLGGESKFVVL